MSFDQLFLRLYSFQFFLLLLCAFVYFKAAEMEDASPLLWAGLSVAVYLGTWMVLNWGILGCLGGQVALLGAITVFRLRK